MEQLLSYCFCLICVSLYFSYKTFQPLHSAYYCDKHPKTQNSFEFKCAEPVVQWATHCYVLRSLEYTVCYPSVQLLSIPADYSCDEQRDGSDVTFVPHIVNVRSHTLTPGHCAYKESL